MGDESIQFLWCLIDVDISDLKNSVQLLSEIVETYVTARGFAMSSAWLEQYKKAQDKNANKSKCLKNYVGVRKDCTQMS